MDVRSGQVPLSLDLIKILKHVNTVGRYLDISMYVVQNVPESFRFIHYVNNLYRVVRIHGDVYCFSALVSL